MTSQPPRLLSRPRSSRAGLTIAEVVVCTLLVSLLMLGSLESLGQLVHSRQVSSQRARAQQLAVQLLVECVDKHYEEPGGSPALGLDAGENSGNRLPLDDVDDYHLWSATPPQGPDGAALPNLSGWRRDVTVEWVELNDPSTVAGSDQGLKRITVAVSRDGTVLAEAVALRSDVDSGG